jgi:hypothetical protein
MPKIRIFLDDERPTPDGWIHCRWPQEVIDLLKANPENVEIVSLDHDLADEMRNGYQVLLWIEEAVVTRGYRPPQLRVHSSNSSAAQKMQLAISQIEKMVHSR